MLRVPCKFQYVAVDLYLRTMMLRLFFWRDSSNGVLVLVVVSSRTSCFAEWHCVIEEQVSNIFTIDEVLMII